MKRKIKNKVPARRYAGILLRHDSNGITTEHVKSITYHGVKGKLTRTLNKEATLISVAFRFDEPIKLNKTHYHTLYKDPFMDLHMPCSENYTQSPPLKKIMDWLKCVNEIEWDNQRKLEEEKKRNDGKNNNANNGTC